MNTVTRLAYERLSGITTQLWGCKKSLTRNGTIHRAIDNALQQTWFGDQLQITVVAVDLYDYCDARTLKVSGCSDS